MILKRFCEEGRITSFGKHILLAALFVVLGSVLAVGNYNHKFGMDFYQYWGIGLGPKISDGALKSPYVEMSTYAAFLDSYASRSNDIRLIAANKKCHSFYEKGLDIPGTPLQYAMFAAMPQNYSAAYGIFLATQTAFFIGALALLFSYNKEKRALLIPLSAALMACYWPFRNDLSNGNLAATQLFFLVVLIVFYDKVLKNATVRHAYVLSAVFTSALVLLTLMKPNITLVALFLSASLWRLHGMRVFFSSAAIAGLFGAALVALSCMYFGSWDVWRDWLGYFPDVSKSPMYAILRGNSSTSLIVSDLLHINIRLAIALIIFLLSLHGFGVFAGAKPKEEAVLKYIKTRCLPLLEDPYLSASLAVTVTLAVSPLVWPHYHILSLLPAFWLIATSPRWSFIELLGVLSILITSMMLPYLLGEETLAPYTAFSGWIPLWFGVQAVMASRIRNPSERIKKASNVF
jgi:hypothetical protein